MVSRSVEQGANSNRNKKNSESDSVLSKEMRFALSKRETHLSKDRKKKKQTPSVNRGRESNFWKNIKEITPNIYWTRIETYGTPGLPDLLGVCMHEPKNISFWCELKIAKGHQLLLSPFQISWNVKRFSLCQDNFVMAKIPETREICLWSGSLVRELAVNYTEVEPLFVVKQPYKDSLEPSIKKVLSKI